MLILLSPAKRQDFDRVQQAQLKSTCPVFLTETRALVDILKTKSAGDLQKLMSISSALGQLNFERFQSFEAAPERPAIFAFQGDVYQGLSAETLSPSALEFAQKHLLILSGLYGVLRPFDHIQPHRLEMGAVLATRRGANLYQYWGGLITEQINQSLAEQKNPVLINLASQEYFKSVQLNLLQYPVLHIDFKEYRQGQYRVIALMAKRARGKMARYIIENQLAEPASLQSFAVDDYRFSAEHSGQDRWVFVR